MGEKLDTLYVVTGISRLTGEREACSLPAGRVTAGWLLHKWMAKPARKRSYLRLKVEPYNPVINFKNNE